MPKVRVGDVALHYVEAGTGEPLLLVMGLGGDHLAWGLQMPVFAQRYRVIAFDNRGVGQSDVPDHPYTTRLMAEDAAGLLAALGVARAHVIGLSMGGMIAQELALNHPARVRTLQLHATYARPDGYLRALVAAWRTVRAALGREEALRTMALWLFTPEAYDERPQLVETLLQTALANPYPQSVTGFMRQTDAVLAHDTLDRLAAIRCPTLVSVADQDVLVPPRFSRELAARIPGAELVVIPGSGHVALWEHPDAFTGVCLAFLAKHSTA
jgi:pimeloyl-ACP methyl ester carboxylesterase